MNVTGEEKESRLLIRGALTVFSLFIGVRKILCKPTRTVPKHVLLPLDSSNQGAMTNDKRRMKEKEHGIFFEDNYDYLQHIKPRTNLSLEPLPENVTVIEAKKPTDHLEFGNVKLPSEAFASRYEENEGLLNLAAPTSDLDPDIVAALDDAIDLENPDNILEDDFMLKANKEAADDESDDDDDDLFPSDEADDSESDDGMSFFEEEETKSRFTNYSMTSSVVRRNEGLQLIDERFEKVMEEYDEDEIGALDHEELEGTVNPDSGRLNALAEEFIESQQSQDLPKMKGSETGLNHDNDNDDDDSDNLPNELVRITEEPKEKWDCESILSTYSNLYNHPTLIKDSPKVKPIKLSKAGIPLGVFTQPGGSSKDVKATEDMETEETETHIPRNTIRSKDETKEEKKERKQEIKSDRKVRRMEKKANKIAFKSEKQRQEQSMLNTKQQQGKKL
ncbi:Protein ltv1 [Desmophyllum pertusum]|uniref:Protein LTV1 homolog n=1 Tax=Desmophyllum pertusum TaxID=174260 RepID=A0A9X0A1I8_9CNID|nr:Protein ltv1 [Desmophyllum pertusum]